MEKRGGPNGNPRMPLHFFGKHHSECPKSSTFRFTLLADIKNVRSNLQWYGKRLENDPTNRQCPRFFRNIASAPAALHDSPKISRVSRPPPQSTPEKHRFPGRPPFHEQKTGRRPVRRSISCAQRPVGRVTHGFATQVEGEPRRPLKIERKRGRRPGRPRKPSTKRPTW